jgi:thioredoxin reductase
MAQSLPRIAVLGAGPVGLEAALYALALKLPVTVFERGRVGENILRWGHLKLFTPFGLVATTLGRAAIKSESPKHELPADNDCVTGRDYVGNYLEPLAMSGQLIDNLKLDSRVMQVGRTRLLKNEPRPSFRNWSDHPFRILVRDTKGEESMVEADIVLDSTGTFGQPRWLGESGIPAIGEIGARPQIAGGVEDVLGKDRGKYAAKSVLVVGGGYTAATHVCLLADLAANHPEQWTIWLARDSRSTPLPRYANDPFRERDRLAARANMLACRGEGNLEFHASSTVQSILSHGPDKGFTVTARVAGKAMTWNVDRVIASVGYSPDGTLYRELHVQECPATLAPLGMATALSKSAGDEMAGAPGGAAALKTAEPNYFVLGAKSFGRGGQFLMRSGFQQVRDVFSLITGKSQPLKPLAA